MEFSIVFKSVFVIFLFRILPLVQTEPRAAEIIRDKSVYSTFFKRSLSSNLAPDEAKMILTNSIGDDGEKSGNQGESSSVVKNKAKSGSKSNANASRSDKADPPIFNVIPDSSDKDAKPKPIHDSTSLMPNSGDSSIVSDMLKEPQVLMDVFKLKLARVKQVAVAVLMFAIAIILKALLTTWVPYLMALPVIKVISNVAAQEAGREVLGNGIMYAISSLTDKFG